MFFIILDLILSVMARAPKKKVYIFFQFTFVVI
jgi:hypothetical protein